MVFCDIVSNHTATATKIVAAAVTGALIGAGVAALLVEALGIASSSFPIHLPTNFRPAFLALAALGGAITAGGAVLRAHRPSTDNVRR
jgi:hypothetical protein